jgi:hypothetical protein
MTARDGRQGGERSGRQKMDETLPERRSAVCALWCPRMFCEEL